MNPENKKISFGFTKLIKKQNILPRPVKNEQSVELIECLEGSEIKMKNAIEKIEKGPLVINIKGNANNLVDRIERESLKNRKIEIKEEEDNRPDSELTVEELAARQLLREAKNRLMQEKDTTKVHTLPMTEENILEEDAQEPSIEDYDNVPISDYGLAMLRGMGWKEGMNIGRNQSKSVKPIEPELRPKGLGLGAQKIVDSDPKDVFDKSGKQLFLVKGAFAKIIAGTHKGAYCEVQGLDEESGRIIVKTSYMNEILTLNELFVTPVTEEDYSLGSKILNNVKYERYKEGGNADKKNTSDYYLPEGDKCGGSYTSLVGVANKKQEHKSSLHQQNVKTEREDSTDDTKSSERKKKYLTSSSKDEYDKRRSQERLKIKEQKQSTSRSKSTEKKHSSKKHSYKKERKYSSEDDSSEDEYYSRKKNSNHSKADDYSSSISSSSDEEKQQNKKKKNKKYKKEKENSSDSDYRSRKSKKQSKKKENRTKDKKKSKAKKDSSSDNSEGYEKYRNRRR